MRLTRREGRASRSGARSEIRPGIVGRREEIEVSSGRTRAERNAHEVRSSDARLLATLLDVVADELLRVVLEDLVDLVEQVVDLGLQPLAALGGRRRLFDRPRPARLGAGRRFCSRSAIYLSLCARVACQAARPGVSHLRAAYRHALRVPRSGSIIGTRRNGSSPRSKTIESQLAATIERGAALQALAPEIGPRGRRGGSVTAASTSSSS